MSHHFSIVLLLVAIACPAFGAPLPKSREERGHFLIRDLYAETTAAGLPFKRVRLALLDADGREIELIKPPALSGSLSPDGQWLASMEFDGDRGGMNLFLRPRNRRSDPVNVPLKWDIPGQSGTALIWSADSRRLLVGENRAAERGGLEFAYRIHNVAAGKATELTLTEGHWVTSWSSDGKTFITTFWSKDNSPRIARIAADGTGKAEFLTPED